MDDSDRLWMGAFGFVYFGDGKRLLKGVNVKGACWIRSHGDRSAVRLCRPDDGEADSCQANELSDTGSIQFCFSYDIISAFAAV